VYWHNRNYAKYITREWPIYSAHPFFGIRPYCQNENALNESFDGRILSASSYCPIVPACSVSKTIHHSPDYRPPENKVTYPSKNTPLYPKNQFYCWYKQKRGFVSSFFPSC